MIGDRCRIRSLTYEREICNEVETKMTSVRRPATDAKLEAGLGAGGRGLRPLRRYRPQSVGRERKAGESAQQQAARLNQTQRSLAKGNDTFKRR
jgi:hypothetical protein